MRIATVWEEMLNNSPEAIKAWKAVLKDNAENVQALRSLDRLYLRAGDFRELGDNIQRQLKLTKDPDETIALLGRLGNLREKQLSEAGAAVETYRKILEIEPEHPDTLAALERILPNPEQELGVAQLLEPVYKARGDWPRLIAVYEIEARHAVDPEQKIAFYKQIADGYEVGLDDPDHAYEALGWALREDPQNSEVQGAIERLARALEKLADLVALYGSLVSSVPDAHLKNALYHKIARLYEVDLGMDEQAADAYASALDVSPRDIDAANALEQLYLRRGDYPNLVELLLRKADIVGAPDQKKALYYKAAQIYEEVLENVEKAIDVYRQVLTVDDSDPMALDHLERLYIRLSRWADLKDVYAKKAELAQNPQDKKQMLFVLGQVYDRELGDRRARSRPIRRSSISIRTTSTPRRRSTASICRPSAGTTCWRCSSARSSWRPLPPRSCRCASASVSCGASTSRTSRAPSRRTARSWQWIRRTSRRWSRSTA